MSIVRMKNGYKIVPYADLRRADLREIDLRGSQLQSANLQGADLRRADLRGALGVYSINGYLYDIVVTRNQVQVGCFIKTPAQWECTSDRWLADHFMTRADYDWLKAVVTPLLESFEKEG